MSENVKGKVHLRYKDIDGRIILKCMLSEWGVKVWAGIILLRMRSRGGLLGTRNTVMNLHIL
jgi:hypothetical protein